MENRKLKAYWSYEAQQDLRCSMSSKNEAALINVLAQEVLKNIDIELTKNEWIKTSKPKRWRDINDSWEPSKKE